MKWDRSSITTVAGILISAVPSTIDASSTATRILAAVGAAIALVGVWLGGRDAKPFVVPFDATTWQDHGDYQEILIPAARHRKGANASARVEVAHLDGFAECMTEAVSRPNGDVLIRINSGRVFDGRIVIS